MPQMSRDAEALTCGVVQG